jgi:hypothetical protein
MLECDEWPTRIASDRPVWSKANPGHAICNPVARGFVANTADTDDGLEWPGTDTAHTAIDAEPARRVGIANVRALVDQRSGEREHREFWMCGSPSFGDEERPRIIPGGVLPIRNAVGYSPSATPEGTRVSCPILIHDGSAV